jgi:hypothetical protein
VEPTTVKVKVFILALFASRVWGCILLFVALIRGSLGGKACMTLAMVPVSTNAGPNSQYQTDGTILTEAKKRAHYYPRKL